MTVVNSFPNDIDMQHWVYPALEVSHLHAVNRSPTEVNFLSDNDPYAYVSLHPEMLIRQLRIVGTGFGDFDANGVPHTGTVTSATLSQPSGFVVFFEGFGLPVGQLLNAVGSSSPTLLQDTLLGGDDRIEGGSHAGGTFGEFGDQLLGGAGDDTINGNGSRDTIYGGAGDDVISIGQPDVFGHAECVVDGGAGVDTLSFSPAPAGVIVDLTGAHGQDTITGVEWVIGSRFADDITGSAAADTLQGLEGADTLTGGSGDDTLYGDTAGERLDGGAGVDTVSYVLSSTSVAVDLATGRGGPSGSDILSGFEHVNGSLFADTLSGGAGADTLDAGQGADQVMGRAGDDLIFGGLGENYLRGDDGADNIFGGADFDDINGNMGNDTADGGLGDDWVVGGKDNDLLWGDAGGDVVWGNLGNDTQDGGDGNDQVRGGQGDDSVTGGAGDDYVSGDRGNDAVAGGAGADLFHGSQDAGVDVVLDFHLSEGDRVMLDPGTTYTLSQSGADTLIDMGGGHQMILKGVLLSSLSPGWIFGA